MVMRSIGGVKAVVRGEEAGMHGLARIVRVRPISCSRSV